MRYPINVLAGELTRTEEHAQSVDVLNASGVNNTGECGQVWGRARRGMTVESPDWRSVSFTRSPPGEAMLAP